METAQEHETTDRHQHEDNSAGNTMDGSVDGCLVQWRARGVHYEGARNKITECNDREQDQAASRSFPIRDLG